MAQPRLPVLNKTGYSMFWNSVWNDHYNYTRNLKEDTIISNIVPNFIDTFFLSLKQFYNKNMFKSISKINGTYSFDTDIFLYRAFCNKLNRRYHKLYFFKTWVIKFQTWIVVYSTFINTKFLQELSYETESDTARAVYYGYNLLAAQKVKSIEYYLNKYNVMSFF
jgi:hypothetical protein